MLNPFIFDPKGKWAKDSRPVNEQRYAQNHGIPVGQPAGRNRLTLRLGKLLIRMGKGLTGDAAFPEGSRESWLRGNPADTRPARLHQA